MPTKKNHLQNTFLDGSKIRGSPVDVTFLPLPKQSLYGIFPYIYHRNQPNVGKYTIHGWYGLFTGFLYIQPAVVELSGTGGLHRRVGGATEPTQQR